MSGEPAKDETPTNSPPKAYLTPPVLERSESPPREPNIKIFCDNFQEILSKMVCPSCEEILTSPVRICMSGHSYCEKCLPPLTLCLICFKPLTNIHNQNVMKILTLASFSCPENLHGCTARLPLSNISEHHKYCHFMPTACPASREKGTYCAWLGLKKNLLAHVKTHKHQELPAKHPFFVDSCRLWPEEILRVFLLYADEVFTYYSLVFSDTWYSAVHQIGLTRRKYECSFKLNSINGKDHIRVTLPIPDAADDSSCSLFSGKCFRIPVNVIQHFVQDRHINLTIFINDITKTKTPQ